MEETEELGLRIGQCDVFIETGVEGIGTSLADSSSAILPLVSLPQKLLLQTYAGG